MGSAYITSLTLLHNLYKEVNMKITWDNIDEFRFNHNGDFRRKGTSYILREGDSGCDGCKKPYFANKFQLNQGKGAYCDNKCQTNFNHPLKGLTGENSPNYGQVPHNKGKKTSKETRVKLSKLRRGKNNPNYGKGHLYTGKNNNNWKGGVKDCLMMIYFIYTNWLFGDIPKKSIR